MTARLNRPPSLVLRWLGADATRVVAALWGGAR